MAIQDFSRSLPIMLYKALDGILPKFRCIFNDYDLTEQQWRILRVLWEHEKIALGKLAELTLIPPPSLVGIVDRLLAANLIKRDRSAYDRRVVFILATQKGKDLESKVMPRVNDIYNEIRESFRTTYPKVSFNDCSKKQIIDLMQSDKKNSHGQIKFVLLQSIGQCQIDIEVEDAIIYEAFDFYSEKPTEAR